jgi:putative tricarboxylic transport membrane protein
MNLRRMPKDFWVGLVILLGAALYWSGAASIPISALDGEINAAAVPRMLALALAVLAVILMIKALIDARNLAVTAAENEVSEREERLPKLGENMRALGLILIGGVYLLLLPFLGYFLCVALLVVAVARYMGEPYGLSLALTSLGLALAFQFLFVQFLRIQLPLGKLFEQLSLF